ncbi:hypothetical protein MCUN1_002858 [Malassezia cuniculi]|uniref:SP-RING-type domain-containing protein n=1 Tax=Malassezia cuniculi TaxID=948313 RepID=A0AAF0EWE9_9BASI|nr:hypothetical protein MCUN1_002858 [Malassezia cuniculi]
MQGVDPELGSRVRRLVGEYGVVRDSINAALAFLPDAAADLAEFPSETERVQELDGACRELIDMLHAADARAESLTALHRSIADGRCTEPAETYEKSVGAALSRYDAQTTRQKYARNKSYIEFRSRVWEVQGEGAMPPLTDAIPAEPGDDGNDSDELEIGGAHIDYRCPLTAALLVDPVINSACAHAYSREAVLQYIASAQQNMVRAKCPAAGCTENLSARSLREAPDLRRRVERGVALR